MQDDVDLIAAPISDAEMATDVDEEQGHNDGVVVGQRQQLQRSESSTAYKSCLFTKQRTLVRFFFQRSPFTLAVVTLATLFLRPHSFLPTTKSLSQMVKVTSNR
jgi:hypothetical protein